MKMKYIYVQIPQYNDKYLSNPVTNPIELHALFPAIPHPKGFNILACVTRDPMKSDNSTVEI